MRRITLSTSRQVMEFVNELIMNEKQGHVQITPEAMEEAGPDLIARYGTGRDDAASFIDKPGGERLFQIFDRCGNVTTRCLFMIVTPAVLGRIHPMQRPMSRIFDDMEESVTHLQLRPRNNYFHRISGMELVIKAGYTKLEKMLSKACVKHHGVPANLEDLKFASGPMTGNSMMGMDIADPSEVTTFNKHVNASLNITLTNEQGKFIIKAIEYLCLSLITCLSGKCSCILTEEWITYPHADVSAEIQDNTSAKGLRVARMDTLNMFSAEAERLENATSAERLENATSNIRTLSGHIVYKCQERTLHVCATAAIDTSSDENEPVVFYCIDLK